MPDSTGFGAYTEAGQVIPCQVRRAARATYTHNMFLNDHPPIAAGRELWGFPKKLAGPPSASHRHARRHARLWARALATGTMGYKHGQGNADSTLAELAAPNFLVKIIPHVDGSPRVCELVEYRLEDIQLKGVWSGPGALSLHAHALAPVAELPVLEVVSTVHLVADLTLGLGKVVLDYLEPAAAYSPRIGELPKKAA